MKGDVFGPLARAGISRMELMLAVYEVLAVIDPTQSLSRLLTVSDVAELLNVHADTVRKYLREKKIRAFKLDGDREWRVKPMDYIDFLEGKSPTRIEKIMKRITERQSVS